MTVAVIGADTAVGRALGAVLGDRVVPADPGSLAGATTVIDVADAAVVPHGHDVREAVLDATRRAVGAAERSDVRHFVFVSSAGLGRPAEEAHFTARLGAEALVEASPVPHTIVRTTQLFESVQRVVQGGRHGERTRGRVVIQPIAARDVAAEVAAIALDPPRQAVIALAGPDGFHLDEPVERLRLARFFHREGSIDLPVAADGATGSPVPLRGGTATLTGTRFEDWVAATAARA